MSVILDALDKVLVKKDLGEFKYVDSNSFNSGHTSYCFTVEDREHFFADVTVIDNISEYEICSNGESVYIVEGIDEIIPAMYKVLCATYNKYLDDNKKLDSLVERFGKQIDCTWRKI